jgi:hypothetical protein
MAPSGVAMIGLALVLRDLVQRRLGVGASALAILVGAAISAALAPPALVIASAAAFLLSELADMAVYTPLQRRRLVLAVALSSVAGLVVVSVVFLLLAFGSLDFLAGQVIGKADFVVVATPLTDATRNLIDAAMLDRMKQGAGLMNIGRAAVVDYDALCVRLASGRLSGAILDVFSPEPLPATSPLWAVPNLMVLPHITCDDPRYIEYLLDFWFENFGRWLAGRKLKNIVEPARGY